MKAKRPRALPLIGDCDLLGRGIADSGRIRRELTLTPEQFSGRPGYFVGIAHGNAASRGSASHTPATHSRFASRVAASPK